MANLESAFKTGLFGSAAGLIVRIALGVAIFAIFALVDLRRNGAAATRWREYLILLSCVAAAMLYGILNDQITSRISWEYFYYGKELAPILGPQTPPDPSALHREAAKVGMKATWSVGLLIGVALLIANNPRRNRPRLPYAAILRRLPLIFGFAAGCALLGGFAGHVGLFDHAASDFDLLTSENLWRPRRFLCTWGIHLGGYIGGALGTLAAVLSIHRERRAFSGLSR